MNDSPCLLTCGVSASVWAYRVRPGRQTVGGAPDCELRLDHISVSRHHAAIWYERNALSIRDLESTNGTFIDGVRVGEAAFVIGNTLRLGKVALEVMSQVDALRRAPSGLEPTEPEREDSEHRDVDTEGLTRAQERVFWLLLDALHERDIATRLHVTVDTVHSHKRVIYKVFGVRSHAELIARFRSDAPPK